MLKPLKLFLVAILSIFPAISFALSSEVHITKDGVAKIESIKVTQLAGPTLFTRLYWGDAFVRVTVKTDSKTVFYRATGEKTSLQEIAVDNILNIEGELEPGGSALVVLARVIKNVSVEKEQAVLKGKVLSVDTSNNSIVLEDTKRGRVTLQTSSSTQFLRGVRAVDIARVKVGDTIKQATGDYDIRTRIMVTKAVVVFVDQNTFFAKVHTGTVNAINGTTLPTSISISLKSGGIYNVYLTATSSVINKARSPTSLSRFEVGDFIRLYGAIRDNDFLEIDAEVIRNMDL